MSGLKGALALFSFLALTLPLMPVQWLFLRTNLRWARALPNWYARQVCKILGLRVHMHGRFEDREPVLIASNHSSWLDIVVLSSLTPVSFVAKREVGEWPMISSLARLQRTLFIDRERRSAVADISALMDERLAAGDNIVLFPEGTSSGGNVVLPFRSSLLAPLFPGPQARAKQRVRQRNGAEAGLAEPSATSAPERSKDASPRRVLQTCAIAYTHLQGIPIGRENRARVAWYGDMDMLGHGWHILKSGPIDVHVAVRAPIDLANYPDRKALAKTIEDHVREDFARLVRHGGAKATVGEGLPVGAPSLAT